MRALSYSHREKSPGCRSPRGAWGWRYVAIFVVLLLLVVVVVARIVIVLHLSNFIDNFALNFCACFLFLYLVFCVLRAFTKP